MSNLNIQVGDICYNKVTKWHCVVIEKDDYSSNDNVIWKIFILDDERYDIWTFNNPDVWDVM